MKTKPVLVLLGLCLLLLSGCVASTGYTTYRPVPPPPPRYYYAPARPVIVVPARRVPPPVYYRGGHDHRYGPASYGRGNGYRGGPRRGR
ncbi:hypothetical protein Q5H93_16555 [Hymenobacter sp. ASUV-10]|uniref:Lipoprotein n=1 Tax=Hymenobacter aranciens TaxID=3063996 RepID=A0ABT9BH76_9BACT|nr:hypothetical protein [Hymenobacter sp. ASUV-10]MDO7876357.1 hypothetical protein [Hymenobacter sp. ASUV-10]